MLRGAGGTGELRSPRSLALASQSLKYWWTPSVDLVSTTPRKTEVPVQTVALDALKMHLGAESEVLATLQASR